MAPPTVRLEQGETGLFGYGSLISIASLEKTLKRKYTGPFPVCQLNGWWRGWDVGMPMPNNRIFYAESPNGRMYPRNILYLNVRPMFGSIINGIYQRVDITEHLQNVKVESGRAYVYVAKPKYK